MAKSNLTKIKELFSVDYELKNYTDEHTDFGLCWMHKETGDYLTHEGLELDFKFLLKHNIDKYITSSLGFSSKDQKWYGWSHRAFYGFKVGSTVSKGDCAYTPKTPQELFDSVTEDWIDTENATIIDNGIRIEHRMSKCGDPECPWGTDTIHPEPNEELPLAHKNHECQYIPAESDFQTIECGKGEWTAKTLDDAKQMAIDFAKSVS
ncbi:MAG: hypothetical protein ACTSRU_19440 [Candidatus Hodarchaeales archaeon]